MQVGWDVAQCKCVFNPQFCIKKREGKKPVLSLDSTSL